MWERFVRQRWLSSRKWKWHSSCLTQRVTWADRETSCLPGTAYAPTCLQIPASRLAVCLSICPRVSRCLFLFYAAELFPSVCTVPSCLCLSLPPIKRTHLPGSWAYVHRRGLSLIALWVCDVRSRQDTSGLCDRWKLCWLMLVCWHLDHRLYFIMDVVTVGSATMGMYGIYRVYFVLELHFTIIGTVSSWLSNLPCCIYTWSIKTRVTLENPEVGVAKLRSQMVFLPTVI